MKKTNLKALQGSMSPIMRAFMGLAQSIESVLTEQERRIAALEKSTPKSINLFASGTEDFRPNNHAATIMKIFDIVMEVTGAKKEVFTTDRRREFEAWPRRLAMHFAVRFKLGSTEEIRPLFKRKDHTTILSAHRSVGLDIATNRAKKAQYDACMVLIHERLKLVDAPKTAMPAKQSPAA